MRIAKYQNEQESRFAANKVVTCEICNPIIFQVFLSSYANECTGDYEPEYFNFDFTNNGYGEFIAEIRERAEEENDYYEDDIYTATPIETRSIQEIEKGLVALVPVEPAIYKSLTTIYEDCKKGNAYFHQQDYDKAIEYYRAAANNNSSDHIAFCLSLSYYLKGDYVSAVAAANHYYGSVYELPTFSRGLNCFVLDTTPIDELNYLLEKRITL
jgi:tetratricopeptide (TPR) repeat protein